MEVAANGRCAHCGKPLQIGAGACPACGAQLDEPLRRPHFTFAVLIALLVIGFTVTGFIVRGFDARREQLAERWFRRGERNLQSGAALQAIDEFETALAYSRDNDRYRLKLAQALMQANKWEEARAHLLNLWEQRPGDGEVNLLLARVFAQRNITTDAVRHYHAAIYGVWETNPVANRERARFELIDLLLSKGQQEAAQSELIALASEPPAGLNERLRLANLMLKANEPQRALDIFQQVRRRDRENFDAVLGAARAEFALLRFASALQLASEASNLKSDSTQAAQLVTETSALVQADPRARGISAAERVRRVFTAYGAANARLASCAAAKPGDPHLQELAAIQRTDVSHLAPARLRDPDVRDQVVRWAYDVETASAKVCGVPSGSDASLLMLARAQEKER